MSISLWGGQVSSLASLLVTPTCSWETGPQGGNGDTAQLSKEEESVSDPDALLGWLVWNSQLGKRQVLGI